MGCPKSQGSPLMAKNIRKIVRLLIYIAWKKGFDALNATQETSALCKVPFLKNQEKLAKIAIFEKIVVFEKLVIFEKMVILGSFLGLFPKMVLCRELRFIVWHSVHQTPSFEVSKPTIRQFFRFFIPKPLKMAENQKQK